MNPAEPIDVDVIGEQRPWRRLLLRWTLVLISIPVTVLIVALVAAFTSSAGAAGGCGGG